MLECIECKNYVCRFCVEDIIGKPYENIRCPFCDKQPFILSDVCESEQVKRYTDTPYSSAASGFKFAPKNNILKPAKDENIEPQPSNPLSTNENNNTKIPELFCSTAPEFFNNVSHKNADSESVILGRNYLLKDGKKYYRCYAKTISENGDKNEENLIENNSEILNNKENLLSEHSEIAVNNNEIFSDRGHDFNELEEQPSKYEKESEPEFAKKTVNLRNI